MVQLGHKDLGGRVIAAAIAVHGVLGPGFVEVVSANEFYVEPTAREIKFEQQKAVKIQRRGVDVGAHRLDLLVEGCTLVDLKAIKEIEDIFSTIGRPQKKAAGISRWIEIKFCCNAANHKTERSRFGLFKISA